MMVSAPIRCPLLCAACVRAGSTACLRAAGMSPHERLYEASKKHRLKREALFTGRPPGCTFKPDIPEVRRW
jgi:hypothetical protein